MGKAKKNINADLPDKNFELIQPGGRGTYAQVWKAKQVDLDRFVAIKFLHPSAAGQMSLLEHAKGHARAGDHVNLVTVHSTTRVLHPDTGAVVDAVVFEWLEGERLCDRLLTLPLFEPKEAEALCNQLIAGIEHLHSKKLVHGDLHNENVLLVASVPKIIDIDYSHSRSLQLLQTMTREGRLVSDIRSLGFLFRDILKRTNMDFTEALQVDAALRGAENINDLRSIVKQIGQGQSQAETTAAAPETDFGIRVRTDGGEKFSAITAIEQNRSDSRARVEDSIGSIVDEIIERAPEHIPGRVPVATLAESIITAISATQSTIVNYLRIVKAACDSESAVSVATIFKSLTKLLEHYELSRNFSGGTHRPADFDYFRFIGAEMMLGLIATLLRADRLALISHVLDQRLYISNAYGAKPDLIDFTYAATSAEFLWESQRQNPNYGPPLLLASRYTLAPLSEILSADDLRAADFLLYLRDPQWLTSVARTMNEWPPFIIKAKQVSYAEELAALLKMLRSNLSAEIQSRFLALAERHREWRPLHVLRANSRFNEIATVS